MRSRIDRLAFASILTACSVGPIGNIGNGLWLGGIRDWAAGGAGGPGHRRFASTTRMVRPARIAAATRIARRFRSMLATMSLLRRARPGPLELSQRADRYILSWFRQVSFSALPPRRPL